MISKRFWDEISIFDDIIIPISGGVDSTYTYQIFKEKGLKFRLLWNNTGRSLSRAREVLAQIFGEGYEFNICIPGHDQKFITMKTKESFRKILDGEIKKVKKNIACCYYLKEKPFANWLKNYTDSFSLIISGLAPYEGKYRNIHLGQLRKQNRFLRFKKKEQRWFAYPLRDYNKQSDRQFMIDFLMSRNLEVKSSGCYTCPILVLFEEYFIEKEPERLHKSKLVYK